MVRPADQASLDAARIAFQVDSEARFSAMYRRRGGVAGSSSASLALFFALTAAERQAGVPEYSNVRAAVIAAIDQYDAASDASDRQRVPAEVRMAVAAMRSR